MSEESRLDRLETLAEKILEGLEQTRQRTDSNARSIEALANSNASSIEALTKQYQRLATDIFSRIDEMQRQVTNMQRQVIDVQRRIDDNTANIRELAMENQRILRYLESLVHQQS